MTSSRAIAVQRDLFNYGELSAPAVKQCEAAVERITKYQRRMAGDIVAIGNELLTAKSKLEHGQFGEWIRHYFGWSQPTASRMMQAAETFKSLNLNNLTIDTSALYLLSSDKCPDETRDEFIERAERGERITHAAVKQELDADKYEPTYDDRLDKLMARLRSMADGEHRSLLLASLKIICQELEDDE